ncbi:hypothetical protein OQA88_2711 [Cercophora sp. LCS_1]
MTDLRETMTQTLRKVLHAYVDVSTNRDITLLSTDLDPSCTRSFAPTSFLEAIGVPTDTKALLTNAQYEAAYGQNQAAVTMKTVEISNIVIDTANKTAAAHTKYVNEYKDKGGEEMVMEFAWFLGFNEDGTKVNSIIEFADSLESVRFHERVAGILKERSAE